MSNRNNTRINLSLLASSPITGYRNRPPINAANNNNKREEKRDARKRTTRVGRIAELVQGIWGERCVAYFPLISENHYAGDAKINKSTKQSSQPKRGKAAPIMQLQQMDVSHRLRRAKKKTLGEVLAMGLYMRSKSTNRKRFEADLSSQESLQLKS